MKRVTQYLTEEERANILKENSGLRLKEERNLFEGNYLVFTDEPEPPTPLTIETRVEALETNLRKHLESKEVGSK
jgi:hypothetical protein